MARLKTTRWADLQGALAVAVLEARARGDKSEVVVELPYVTAKTFRAARDFIDRVAPGTNFKLVGADGTSARSSAADGSTLRQRGARSEPETTATSPGELFTDMHQWLLKVLLLKHLERRPMSLRELETMSKAGNTKPSLTSVQRFVEAFTELGHLVRDVDGFRVVRRTELMRRWLGRMEVTREWRIPVRPFYDEAQLVSALARQSAENTERSESKTASAALAGFAACEARGVLHVLERGPLEIHVDGRAMSEIWKHAERCDRKGATVFVIPSAAFALSIYGPLTWELASKEKLQPGDLVQAALDAWTHPLGGKEQAMHIIEDVLEWRDG